MDNIGIYKITNTINNHFYIGSTKQGFKRRWHNHLLCLRKGIHNNPHLQNSYNKYGENAFVFSILEIVTIPEQCIIFEQKYINELKPEYNILMIARENCSSSFSEERRKRISESSKRLKHTDEFKKNLSLRLIGNTYVRGKNLGKRSDETRLKMSKAKKGKPAHNKGIPNSEEQKRKISETAKLRWQRYRENKISIIKE